MQDVEDTSALQIRAGVQGPSEILSVGPLELEETLAAGQPTLPLEKKPDPGRSDKPRRRVRGGSGGKWAGRLRRDPKSKKPGEDACD